MTLFRYKVVRGDGTVVEGDVEAVSRNAAVARALEDGHCLIRLDEALSRGANHWLTRDLFGPRTVKVRQIAVVTRELAMLLGAGLPLDQAFTVLVEVSENRHTGRLLADVQERVRGGATLADALGAQEAAFPRYYTSMVRAGEAGGTLEATLARLADLLENAHSLRESVKSALIYPVILLVFAGLSITVLLTVVLPQFAPMFEESGRPLPWATQLLMTAGDAIGHYGLPALVLAAASVLVLRRLLVEPARRLAWDRMLLRLPVAGGLIARIETARLTRTLGTLLGNGVSILEAMAIVREAATNTAVAAALEHAKDSLKSGKGLAAPLATTGVLPRLATQLIRVGDETGALDAMLMETAAIYDKEVRRSVQRLLTLLVPAITIVLGLLIAGIIASILVAILSVNELAL